MRTIPASYSIGKTYGYVKVKGVYFKNKRSCAIGICLNCREKFYVRLYKLRSLRTLSCGCITQPSRSNSTTHKIRRVILNTFKEYPFTISKSNLLTLTTNKGYSYNHIKEVINLMILSGELIVLKDTYELVNTYLERQWKNGFTH